MFSKTLANEVVKDNIRVNAINPGLVLTPDWVKTAKQLTEGKGGDYEAYLQSVADEHAPIRRFATPDEMADFFVFLCSARASYSVGSTYFVDGGMLKTAATPQGERSTGSSAATAPGVPGSAGWRRRGGAPPRPRPDGRARSARRRSYRA